MISSTMQETGLTTQLLVERMSTLLAHKTVTVQVERQLFRRTFLETATKARQVGGWMKAAGLKKGDCVATFLWNCHEHLELFLGVPSMGGVLHTINARLNAEAVSTMLAETRPRALIADEGFRTLLKDVTLPPETADVLWVIPGELTSSRRLAPGERSYAQAIEGATPILHWPSLDERDACAVCYTSGTSGRSKGVVYSHRSALLHAMAMTGVDAIGLSEHDVCFPVVPMFHALGWGFPYAACLSGASLVFSCRNADPASIAHAVRTTGATLATAVPTVWRAVLDAIHRGELESAELRTLRRLPIGGAAVSRDLVEGFGALGIPVQHCWGMTEISPLGLVSTRRSSLSDREWDSAKLSPGVPLPGCALRVITEEGVAAARDGRMPGELQASGPWVTGAYFDPENAEGHDGDGSFVTDNHGRRWLKTGDIATWDALGYVRIVDRAKDMIKSGGEWISSIELETALCLHPAVQEAAVVGIPDAHWQERPIAYVSLRTDWSEQEPDLRTFLGLRLPKWKVPDRVIVLPELPKGTTGKIDKRRLRSLSAEHRSV